MIQLIFVCKQRVIRQNCLIKYSFIGLNNKTPHNSLFEFWGVYIYAFILQTGIYGYNAKFNHQIA